MRITPLEVHNHQFGTSLRGFDKDEVRSFLAMLSQEYEQVISDNLRQKDQAQQFQSQLSESRAREKGIQKAIEAADRISKEMKEAARRESDVLIKEARIKANKILEQAQARMTGLEERVNELTMLRDTLERRLKGVIEEHLASLDRISRHGREPDKLFVMQRPTA